MSGCRCSSESGNIVKDNLNGNMSEPLKNILAGKLQALFYNHSQSEQKSCAADYTETKKVIIRAGPKDIFFRVVTLK